MHSSKVLPFEPGVGQKMAMRASPTARNAFLELISSFPVHSSLFFYPKTLPSIPVLAVANADFCVGPQNKRGHGLVFTDD